MRNDSVYYLNPLTMMIKPVRKEGKLYSTVFEVGSEFEIKKSPTRIVKDSCKYLGCDYEGRRNGTKALTMVTHKAPIMIDPHLSLFYFPTTSPDNRNCIWMSLDHIDTYRKTEGKQTIVTFYNGHEHLIPISPHSFSTQMMRTSNLRVQYYQNLERIQGFLPGRSINWLASEVKRSYRTND